MIAFRITSDLLNITIIIPEHLQESGSTQMFSPIRFYRFMPGQAPLLLLGGILVALGISLLPAALADKAPQRPADHIHGVEKCQECHTSGVDFAALAKQPDSSCLQCHSADRLKKGLAPARKTPAPSLAESELTAFAPDTPIPPGAGMRYPHYSEKSRLGDAPNEMVLIPAGPFIRGTDDRLPDEGPQHTMELPDYYIDIYEVTNLQYKRFIDETGRRSPSHFRNRTFPPGKADHPVTFVSWKDANDYCAWAGKRLPTDMEWEKAGRGPDGNIFPWGNEFDVNKANTPVRWQAIGRDGDTTPVGAFAEGVSPYGVYDMTGNVWEWTASWYKAYPGNTTESENYGERYKTLKGGSWFDCSFYKCGLSAPLYNRAFFSKRTKNDTFGFRCAKDP